MPRRRHTAEGKSKVEHLLITDGAPQERELMELEKREQVLKTLLEHLTQDECIAVMAKFGFGIEPMSAKALAKHMGWSERRVAELQARALARLRTVEGLEDLLRG